MDFPWYNYAMADSPYALPKVGEVWTRFDHSETVTITAVDGDMISFRHPDGSETQCDFQIFWPNYLPPQ